jgi:general secretion pathway protein A
MYESYYNLDSDPFRLSPDPHFCFRHSAFSSARACMVYALHRAEGFVMVTGRPGTGKTTLINDLLEEIRSYPVVTARLVSTQLAADDLLRLVSFSFGVDPTGLQKAAILHYIEDFLAKQYCEGRHALLIVDEAHDICERGLEELRLLTNLQVGNQPLLQIFLLGQEGLQDVVRAPRMEQLQQRLIAAFHLESLSLDDARAYIGHRLRRSGWTEDPWISRQAYHVIHHFSRGIPRRINLICSRVLLHACVEERHTITGRDTLRVAERLLEERLISSEGLPELRADSFTDESDAPQEKKTRPRSEAPEIRGAGVRQSEAKASPRPGPRNATGNGHDPSIPLHVPPQTPRAVPSPTNPVHHPHTTPAQGRTGRFAASLRGEDDRQNEPGGGPGAAWQKSVGRPAARPQPNTAFMGAIVVVAILVVHPWVGHRVETEPGQDPDRSSGIQLAQLSLHTTPDMTASDGAGVLVVASGETHGQVALGGYPRYDPSSADKTVGDATPDAEVALQDAIAQDYPSVPSTDDSGARRDTRGEADTREAEAPADLRRTAEAASTATDSANTTKLTRGGTPPGQPAPAGGTRIATRVDGGNVHSRAGARQDPSSGHARKATSRAAVDPSDGSGEAVGVRVTEQVRQAQLALVRMGYAPGPVDGIAGPRTTRAVRAYQKAAGLPVDGQVSAMLIESMQHRRPSPPVSSAPPVLQRARRARGFLNGDHGIYARECGDQPAHNAAESVVLWSESERLFLSSVDRYDPQVYILTLSKDPLESNLRSLLSGRPFGLRLYKLHNQDNGDDIEIAIGRGYFKVVSSDAGPLRLCKHL